MKFMKNLMLFSILFSASHLINAQMMSTKGVVSATPSGAANYTIGINVPPGISGVSPKLSLNYNSQGGNSLLGVGWDIAGLSTITRCSARVSTDGYKLVANYSATDKFCMDGQRLVLKSGSYGSPGSVYRTEIDNFSQIIANGLQGTGPASFTVKTKAGLILQYGTTKDSAIKPAYNISSVRLWALNRVSDTVGNYMTITYGQDSSGYGYYPANINYTGNGTQLPTNTVSFAYKDRADLLPSFFGGAFVGNSKILDSIKTYANGILIETYQLTYKNQTYASKLSVLTGIQEIFADGSKLPPVSISWPNVPNLAGNCGTSLSPQACGGALSSNPISSVNRNDRSYDKWQITTGDVNGDGLNDLIGYMVSGSTLRLASWLGKGAGKFNDPINSNDITLPGVSAGGNIMIGDVDGDGLVDIVIPTCSNAGVLSISVVSNFTKTNVISPKIKSYPESQCSSINYFRMADRSGKGRSDLVWVTATGITLNAYSILNDGANGFSSPTLISGPGSKVLTGFTAADIQSNVYWVDIDGDGILDLVTLYSGQTNVAAQYWPGQASGMLGDVVSMLPTTPKQFLGRSKSKNSSAQLQLLDFNGDGLLDLMTISIDKDGANGVSLINSGIGNTFNVPPPPPEVGLQSDNLGLTGVDLTGWSTTYGDIDGDGILDIIVASANGAGSNRVAYIFLGIGDGNFKLGYGSNSNTSTTSGSTKDWNVTAVDLSGVGRSDLIAWNATANGLLVQSWLNNAPGNPKLIKEIYDGISVSVKFNYGTMQDRGLYWKASSAVYPQVDINVPIYLLQSITSDVYTSYRYEGLRTEPSTGRGMVGFSSVETTQTQGDATVVSSTKYSQNWPYTGLPISITKSNSSASGVGKVISKIENTYDCIVTNNTGTVATCNVAIGNSYFPYAKKTTEKSWDLDGTAFPIQTTTNDSYDGFGNVTNTTFGSDDGWSKNTTNTYTNDLSNWYLGRLNKTIAISKGPTGTSSRTSSFSYYPTTGLLSSEYIEPNQSQYCVATNYIYDKYGNTLSTTTGNCVGASGAALFASRTNSLKWDATQNSVVAGQYVTSKKNALGQSESYLYDLRFGLPTQVTGPNGLTTKWTYDSHGRRILETRADGTKTKFQYVYCNWSLYGEMAACPVIDNRDSKYYIMSTPLAADGVTQNGPYSKIYYDGIGRKLRAEMQGFDGNGVSRVIYTDVKYNDLGLVSATTRPYYSDQDPAWSYFNYDALGRVSSTQAADGTETSAWYQGFYVCSLNEEHSAKCVTKNSQGQVISASGVGLKGSRYSYDPYGNILNAAGSASLYDGNINGQTNKPILDEPGDLVRFKYDLRGRKISMSDPDMGSWKYDYDALGQLIGQTDAKGNTTTYGYDLIGRMISRTEGDLISNWYYEKDSTGVACPMGIGKLCQTTSTSGYKKKMSYDSLGRYMGSVTSLDVNYSDNYTYDINGRLATQTYPGGVVIQYMYTPLGYLKSIKRVSSGIQLWTANDMDAENRIAQQTLGNGLQTVQKFNPASGRLSSIYTAKGDWTTAVIPDSIQWREALDYKYCPTGRVSARYETYNKSFDPSQGKDYSYNYNGYDCEMDGRLTGFNYRSDTVPYQYKKYSYDEAGNITNRDDYGTYSYQTLSAPATDMAYGCKTGVLTGSGASSTCVTNVTQASTPVLVCPSGYCNGKPTPQYIYTCPSALTLITPGNYCSGTFVVPAKLGYICPSNATPSGSNCIYGNKSIATPRYSCPSGKVPTGKKCVGDAVTDAEIVGYSCNKGLVLSGNVCIDANTSQMPQSNICPAGQKIDGNYCVASTITNDRPHAVSLITLNNGAGSRFYQYDANGNRTSEVWQTGNEVVQNRSYIYNSFNKAQLLSATVNGKSISESYVYGPEHQRIKQISSTLGTIFYINPGTSADLFFEKQVYQNNTSELRSYITVGGMVVAEIKQITTAFNAKSEQTNYFLRDNLGSTTAVTDDTGAIITRLVYEPFGKRRKLNGDLDPDNTIVDSTGQRGFTNHEHMDELGIINMNGRIYDPVSARFLSADPMIEDPMNSQSFNRYSYIMNNPVSGTDPSGFCWVCDPIGSTLDTVNHASFALVGSLYHWGDVIRTDPQANMIVSIAAAYFAGDYAFSGTAYASTPVAASVGGFAGSMVSSGGDLNAGLQGAATAFMFNKVGTTWNASTSAAANIAGHAAVGCISASMSGGDCGAGAVSSAIADYASINMPGPLKSANSLALNTAYISIIGGTTSVISGGKFANGAQTAAFGYLFNQLMHPDGWDSKSGRGPNMRGTDAEGIARTRLEAEGYSYIDRQVTASEGGQVRIYDLLMSAPDGRNVAVEVKSTIGDVLKLNQAQVNFDAQVYERGATILTPSMANAVTVRQVMYIGVDFGSSAAAAFSSFRLKQILESSGASTQIYRSGRP